MWNDGEELGIQSGFTHRIDEVYEAEKVLKEAIKRRNECFAQLERDLHEFVFSLSLPLSFSHFFFHLLGKIWKSCSLNTLNSLKKCTMI